MINVEKYNSFIINTNNGNSLLNELENEVNFTENLDVLVGYFKITGFNIFCENFKKLSKTRILIGMSTDKNTNDIVASYSKSRTFDFFSEKEREHILSEAKKNIKKELEQVENNFDTEYSVKEFIKLLEDGRIEFRVASEENIHAKVYILKYKENQNQKGIVITGSSNFSESGLKYQHEFNVKLKNEIDFDYAENIFNELWEKAIPLEDTVKNIIDEDSPISDKFTPYDIFVKTLFEHFEDQLRYGEKIVEPLNNAFLKFKFQEDAANTICTFLDDFGGCILADVVGLGKTNTVSIALRKYGDGCKKKLVLCPPSIISNWEEKIRSYGVSADIKSIGIIKELSQSKNLDKYDVVVIDEGHRFRNKKSATYDYLKIICTNKKVIIVTATPFNNSVEDLSSLIYLFQSKYKSNIPNLENLDAFFKKQKSQADIIKKKLSRKEDLLSDPEYNKISNIIREKVLRYIMIRRTRQDIKTIYKEDCKNNNFSFPAVADPKTISYFFDRETNIKFNKTFELLKNFKYTRYDLPYFLKEQITEFDYQRTINLKGFMKNILIKRLESSFFAFKETINRFLQSTEYIISCTNKGYIPLTKALDVDDLINKMEEHENYYEEFIKKDENNKDIIKPIKDFRVEELRDKLNNDLDILRELKNIWDSIDLLKDTKVKKLLETLETDEILNKNESKIIIFTESVDTATYLFNTLNSHKKFKNLVLKYTSNTCSYASDLSLSSKKAREIIEENLSPNSEINNDEEPDNLIKILIATDVLAEGVNLQKSNIILNYDLPWNPTRLIQRIGRVNRIGSKFKEIYIYNFFPTEQSEKEINLTKNIKGKIEIFLDLLGEDNKILSSDEIIESKKLFEKYEESKDESEKNAENSINHYYFTMICNLIKTDPKLIERIKNLPKQIKTARNINADDKDSFIITFFKKNNTNNYKEKFIKFSNDKKESVEIKPIEALKLLECERDEKKEHLPKYFFDYLGQAKRKLCELEELERQTVANGKKSGLSTEKELVKMLEFIIERDDITSSQRYRLEPYIENLKEGIIADKRIKDTYNKIEEIDDVDEILKILKENLQQFNNNEPRSRKEEKIDIILSEYFYVNN